ncbi:MAG: transketolase family protein [Candidatus Kerfeldbacteria bacterium]|nr:transketolase family protein [Candidatus Kerfeldbacteria bacterium]
MPLNQSANLVPNLFDAATIKQAGTRDGYGQGLVELGKQDPRVVVLCADLTESTRSNLFQKAFPDRFIEIGVAEQNLITVGAGLAAAGKIPYMASYAAFAPGRCWEQIRTTFGYNDLHGVVAGAHAGVSVGPDGATHQAVEDIATMRTIAGCTVLAPCDAVRAQQATMATITVGHLCYIRFGRDKYPVFTTPTTPFQIGKAEVFYEGSDVTVVACGPLVYQALLAAKQLEGTISVEVIDSTTIKPLDEATIVTSAKKTGAVVTAEEASIIGGLGGAVAETLSRQYPVPMEYIGLHDIYGESGQADELLGKFQMKAVDIVAAIKRLLQRQ